MHLTGRIKVKLAVFIVVAVAASAIVVFGYMKVPPVVFGVGQYTVRVELPEAAGLYERANVTYRGTKIGQVKSVHLTNTGAEAVLTLSSNVPISSDVDAQVHSMSAIGEQYVALVPRNGAAPPLREGDVIPRSRTSIPPNINSLLDAVNRDLRAIPHDNLKTVIDESSTAVGGLGPDIARLVKGSTTLAIDARKNLDALTTLIDQSQPVLNSQSQTGDDIQAWAAHLATITAQLESNDPAVAAIIEDGGPAADEVRQLFDRLQPTLPILLANLVSVGQVALIYQPNIEQLLVLLPTTIAFLQEATLANKNTKQDFKGAYVAFHASVNLPPPCTTGYLPAQQMRSPDLLDAPDRPAADLYCRIPQDSPYNVRGVRNTPCAGKPWKRAPTVKMCETDEEYVPFNLGVNWKGDPNATLSGQDVGPSPAATPLTPTGAATYDPATGKYAGPDGRIYTQADLVQSPPTQKTWQSMLIPSSG